MNGDKSGESGAFLFSQRVSDFCDGRRSFPTNENSNWYRRGRRRPSAMDFAHYQSPKLVGASFVSQINVSFLENLGQTFGEYTVFIPNRTFFVRFGGISGEFGRAMVRILARRSRAKIPIARPNEPDMRPKRTKKARM